MGADCESDPLFTDFERHRVRTLGADINVVTAGSGPPLLLLHRYPQNLATWHRVAPRLAETYTVVAADLRGYGDSSTPDAGDDHAAYSFREMAADQVEVMRVLGHDRFVVIGHDRGARVAHRMALDHPDRIARLGVFDIVPTRHAYANVDKRLATLYYHWFFLVQPGGLAEHLVGLDPLFYLHATLGDLGSGLSVHASQALASYERCFADANTRHAMFEDYRAAATIDLDHDTADADGRLAMPLLVLWGAKGVVGKLYEPLDVWRQYADDVSGHSLDAGHFLVDEVPGEVLTAIHAFVPATTESLS